MIPSTTLGTTGEQVSAFCLGCLNFGTKTPERIAEKLLDRYAQAGGSFLDTANNYAFWQPGASGGESEAVLGRWMHNRKNRHSLCIATKIGALPRTPDSGFSDTEGLSAQSVASAADKCLERLKTDYIDLLYAHIDDKTVPLEETLEALLRLVQAGKVRRIGCSNYTYGRLAESISVCKKNGLIPYSCIQTRYSYLMPEPDGDFGVQEAADEQLLSYCSREGIGILAYSPLLGGFYNKGTGLPSQYGKADSPKIVQSMNVLKDVAGRTILPDGKTATASQIVFAWMAASSPAVIPVVAASSEAQLAENLAAAEIRLSAEQMDLMNRSR